MVQALTLAILYAFVAMTIKKERYCGASKTKHRDADQAAHDNDDPSVVASACQGKHQDCKYGDEEADQAESAFIAAACQL